MKRNNNLFFLNTSYVLIHIYLNPRRNTVRKISLDLDCENGHIRDMLNRFIRLGYLIRLNCKLSKRDHYHILTEKGKFIARNLDNINRVMKAVGLKQLRYKHMLTKHLNSSSN